MNDLANELLARLYDDAAKAKANARHLIEQTVSDPVERERIWAEHLREAAELLKRS